MLTIAELSILEASQPHGFDSLTYCLRQQQSSNIWFGIWKQYLADFCFKCIYTYIVFCTYIYFCMVHIYILHLVNFVKNSDDWCIFYAQRCQNISDYFFLHFKTWIA